MDIFVEIEMINLEADVRPIADNKGKNRFLSGRKGIDQTALGI
jgi:hypothetical protein